MLNGNFKFRTGLFDFSPYHYDYNGQFQWKEASEVYDCDVIEYLQEKVHKTNGISTYLIAGSILVMLLMIVFVFQWFHTENEVYKQIYGVIIPIGLIGSVICFGIGFLFHKIEKKHNIEPILLVAEGKLTDLKYYWKGNRLPFIIYHNIPEKAIMQDSSFSDARHRIPTPYVNKYHCSWLEQPYEMYDMSWEERNNLFLGKNMLVFRMSNSNRLYAILKDDFSYFVQ